MNRQPPQKKEGKMRIRAFPVSFNNYLLTFLIAVILSIRLSCIKHDETINLLFFFSSQ